MARTAANYGFRIYGISTAHFFPKIFCDPSAPLLRKKFNSNNFTIVEHNSLSPSKHACSSVTCKITRRDFFQKWKNNHERIFGTNYTSVEKNAPAWQNCDKISLLFNFQCRNLFLAVATLAIQAEDSNQLLKSYSCRAIESSSETVASIDFYFCKVFKISLHQVMNRFPTHQYICRQSGN